MVNTVSGTAAPDKLGWTLVHEHFYFAYPGWQADATLAPYDRRAALQAGLEVCRILKSAGIQTVIDATPNDTGGRDPLLYKELSEMTGVNIICVTGLYTETRGAPVYWKVKMAYGADIAQMISELFVTELTQGIGDTGVKAGLIKVSASAHITDYEKEVHKAAVMAQRVTGAPIITHTDELSGIEQADFLLRYGADPKKVLIGHVTNSEDIEYHRAILGRGVCICFDRLGLVSPFTASDEANVRNIATLCKEGYVAQIMLSHDTVNMWLGRTTANPSGRSTTPRRIDHVTENIVPALKARGVTDKQIRIMMVENPKRLFSGDRKGA